jgi:long-subunit fatty acid transport protein
MKRLALLMLVVGIPSLARAGGLEFPGNGTEALGRGAAFTAKADDATAFDYNVAGFAGQRGTRLLFDSNLLWNDYTFQRSGLDPNNGMPFAKVSNSYGIFYAPFLGVSTDFGKLDRWTFALGLFGPSSVGARTYPTTVNGNVAAPQRYDVTHLNTLIVFPTLAAAFRATRWLDIGAQLMLTYGSVDVANVSFAEISPSICSAPEQATCDTTTNVKATGLTATAALGLMFHVRRFMDIGVNVRAPVDMKATGTVYASSPQAFSSLAIAPAPATFETKMPWIVRAGVRYIFRGHDGYEHGDIELDGDYEAWSQVEGTGDQVTIPQLAFFTNIDPTITHHYMDTFSVRLGGAWNAKLPAGVLTFRLGTYYDSNATKYKDTRLDFDTMQKVAGTAGIGYKVRGVALNIAYAYIWEPDRNVTNGDIHAINGINGTTMLQSGADTTVVNNGQYHAQDMILSLGLTVVWDELLGRKRKILWE